MPDFNPSPTGGPDGALAWYQQSLAKVLGLNPANPALPAGLLSDLSTAAQRKALGEVIGKRFRRRVNAVTGAVTIEQVGDRLVLVETDEDSDPVVAGLAATYLGAAKAAIGAIDTDQCIPGVCADQVRSAIRQIEATLDTVIAEAPSHSSQLQMLMHLHELTESETGLLIKLSRDFGEDSVDPVDTLGREHAIGAIKHARDALTSFENAMDEILNCDGERSMTEVGEVVRGCGAHISIHARNVRAALLGAGIGSCELRGVQLPLSTAYQFCREGIKAVSFDQALQALETEPERWARLIADGRRAGFDIVFSSAQTMRTTVEAIDTESILKTLGILGKTDQQSEPREAFALALSFQLDRMCGYAKSVLDMILGYSAGDVHRDGDGKHTIEE